jgi:hypothetical protein
MPTVAPISRGHWYRHRSTVGNIFRHSKLGAVLRHLLSGYPQVNLAWMWGALLAATIAAWLHQLTARTAGQDILTGHGVRGGEAMIATLRWRLIVVPGRPTRHARRKAPQTANPAPAPGPPACPIPRSPAHQDHSPRRQPAAALFAESGQMKQSQ